VKPVLLVIAGPNGTGKTTVTERLRAERWSEGVEYLNPDEIARDRFGDWNSPEAVLQAAQWTEARREQLLALDRGIAFETVFSTANKVDFLRRAIRTPSSSICVRPVHNARAVSCPSHAAVTQDTNVTRT
jgi:predicted ABC-type ATPase